MKSQETIADVVSRLRAAGNEDDAKLVEGLQDKYKKLKGKMLCTQHAADFYARVADLKVNWGE